MTSYWDRCADLYDRFINAFGWAERQLATAEGVSGRVLEVCCGTGYLTLELLKRGLDAYGIDLAPKMVARARQKLASADLDPHRVWVADVTALPFGERTFDYVIATGSLGLLPRPVKRAALKEMARVSAKEMRLLEPIEKREGFCVGRPVTFMVDGHRPIPRSMFEELGLAYRLGWDTMIGVFTYAKVWKLGCAEFRERIRNDTANNDGTSDPTQIHTG
jgi:SAM-dependent methyltransferase